MYFNGTIKSKKKMKRKRKIIKIVLKIHLVFSILVKRITAKLSFTTRNLYANTLLRDAVYIKNSKTNISCLRKTI